MADIDFDYVLDYNEDDVWEVEYVEEPYERSFLPYDDLHESYVLEEHCVSPSCNADGDGVCYTCGDTKCEKHIEKIKDKKICKECLDIVLDNDYTYVSDMRQNETLLNKKQSKMVTQTLSLGRVGANLDFTEAKNTSTTKKKKTPVKTKKTTPKTTKKTKSPVKKTPVKKTKSPVKKATKKSPVKAKKEAKPKAVSPNGKPEKLPGLSASMKYYFTTKGEKHTVKKDDKGLYYTDSASRRRAIKA